MCYIIADSIVENIYFCYDGNVKGDGVYEDYDNWNVIFLLLEVSLSSLYYLSFQM